MTLSTPILVTGAGGFIGAYLVNSLIKSGVSPAEIWACDELEFMQTRECTQAWRGSCVQQISPDDLLHQLGQINPKFVIHMGACSRTDETRWDYLNRVNLEYTKTLWNWCTQHRVPFIYASSAATYGNGELGFDDQMDAVAMAKLEPLNLYGKSKWLFDLWALDEISAGRTPPGYWGFKFFNVYGPGEAHKTSQASVVFHAHQQAQLKHKITLFKSHHPKYRDGEQLRDFVCVEDLAKVCVWTMQAIPKSGIYNVGTGKAQTFIALARAVLAAMGSDAPIEFIPTPEHLRKHYQYFTEANITALREAGYREPFLNLEAGVQFSLREEPCLGASHRLPFGPR